MTDKSRLELFLALNAEAFRRTLGGVGTATQATVGQMAGAFNRNKQEIDGNTAAVKNYNAELSNHGRVLDVLRGGLSALLAPLAAGVSLVAGLGKLVEVTREFDKLNAGLITATGSAAGAKAAFGAIQDFAARTPYDLAQVTDSFVKLVNFGLNPSERAMTSYGNTSSALGKDLNQMIEAVADAATGEFERLKEFGIKAKSEGDNVSFTFRGMTETVGKNAQEIEAYLIRLGEVNFGDAMANRMATLDGAMSNLGDSWDKLWLNLSQTGIGEEIAKGVRLVGDALEELSAMIVSGELEAELTAMAGKWKAWADDVVFSIRFVREIFTTETDGVKTWWGDLVDFLVNAFKEFPENVRALVGLATVALASEFDKMKAKATWLMESVKAIFTDETLEGAWDKFVQQMSAIEQAKQESISSIIAERDTALDSYKKQAEAAGRLRREHEELNRERQREANRAGAADRLGRYQVGPQGGEGQSSEEKNRDSSKGSATTSRTASGKTGQVEESKKKDVSIDTSKNWKEGLVYDEKEGKWIHDPSIPQKQRVRPVDDNLTAKGKADPPPNPEAQGQRRVERRLPGRRQFSSLEILGDSYGNTESFSGNDYRERGGGLYNRRGYVGSRRSRSYRDDDASSGGISAHGGALTDKEWQSLTKEQQAAISFSASQPRKSYDYFNAGKLEKRFRGDTDPTPFLANMAKTLLGLNKTQAAQQRFLSEKIAEGLGGTMTASIRAQLATASEGGSRSSSGPARSEVVKVHEMRFKGGSLRGSGSDIEALLDELAQAGLSAS